MLDLNTVTLVGVDCIDVSRLARAISICKSYANFKEIKLLTSLPANTKYRVEIPHIKNVLDYSKFMIQDLTKYIDTPHVLCIQWDGFILNPNAWDQSFLDYDYIGASWWFSERNVGNGGFSLRSKRFLNESSKMPVKNFHPEDVVLCRLMRSYLESKGIKYAPEETAHRFSHEGNQKYGKTWRNQFGYHDVQMTDISSWEGYDNFIKETKLDY